MKKLMIASAIALMCFSANAFAEDDGYGNDIPTAREEGTVDDGYAGSQRAVFFFRRDQMDTYRSGSVRIKCGMKDLVEAGIHIFIDTPDGFGVPE